jgi:hypothetical protein
VGFGVAIPVPAERCMPAPGARGRFRSIIRVATIGPRSSDFIQPWRLNVPPNEKPAEAGSRLIVLRCD